MRVVVLLGQADGGHVQHLTSVQYSTVQYSTVQRYSGSLTWWVKVVEAVAGVAAPGEVTTVSRLGMLSRSGY